MNKFEQLYNEQMGEECDKHNEVLEENWIPGALRKMGFRGKWVLDVKTVGKHTIIHTNQGENFKVTKELAIKLAKDKNFISLSVDKSGYVIIKMISEYMDD